LDGLTTAGTPCCEPDGAATHTPLKWVATVPSGQPSAPAGAATASDPKPKVSAAPPTMRFRTITKIALLHASPRPARP